MKNRINVTFSSVHWHSWDEIMDLIEETEGIARESVPAMPGSVRLYWRVSERDNRTVSIQVATVPYAEADPEDFEVTLFCTDLEAGTTLRLNGDDITNKKYKGLIAAKLVDILRSVTAVA